MYRSDTPTANRLILGNQPHWVRQVTVLPAGTMCLSKEDATRLAEYLIELQYED